MSAPNSFYFRVVGSNNLVAKKAAESVINFDSITFVVKSHGRYIASFSIGSGEDLVTYRGVYNTKTIRHIGYMNEAKYAIYKNSDWLTTKDKEDYYNSIESADSIVQLLPNVSNGDTLAAWALGIGDKPCWVKLKWNVVNDDSDFPLTEPLVLQSGTAPYSATLGSLTVTEIARNCTGILSPFLEEFYDAHAGRPVVNGSGFIDPAEVAKTAFLLNEMLADERLEQVLNSYGSIPSLEEFKATTWTSEITEDWGYSAYGTYEFKQYRLWLQSLQKNWVHISENLNSAVTIREKLEVMRLFSPLSMSTLPYQLRIDLIEHLLDNTDLARNMFDAENDITGSEQYLLVKIIRSFGGFPSQSIQQTDWRNDFMDFLLEEHSLENNKSVTRFQYMYKHISDPGLYIGSQNRQEYALAMFDIWTHSKFNPLRDASYDANSTNVTNPIGGIDGLGFVPYDVPDSIDEVATPLVYDSRTIDPEGEPTSFSYLNAISSASPYGVGTTLGNPSLYTGTMSFEFDGKYLNVTRTNLTSTITSIHKKYRYHIFQPVCNFDLDGNGESNHAFAYLFRARNSDIKHFFVPIFLHQYFTERKLDDINRKILRLNIDLALTFMPIGQIGYLRFLRFFGPVGKAIAQQIPQSHRILTLRLAADAIQITAGTVSLIVNNLTNFCDINHAEYDQQRCQRWNVVLLTIELSSLATSLVSQRALKGSIRRAVAQPIPTSFDQTTINFITDVLDNIEDMKTLFLSRSAGIGTSMDEAVDVFENVLDASKKADFATHYAGRHIDDLVRLTENGASAIRGFNEVVLMRNKLGDILFLQSFYVVIQYRVHNAVGELIGGRWKHVLLGDFKYNNELLAGGGHLAEIFDGVRRQIVRKSDGGVVNIEDIPAQSNGAIILDKPTYKIEVWQNGDWLAQKKFGTDHGVFPVGMSKEAVYEEVASGIARGAVWNTQTNMFEVITDSGLKVAYYDKFLVTPNGGSCFPIR